MARRATIRRSLAGLTQWLLARGETVHDVPAAATARVRELSRGGRRKNDVIDAAAAASVALLAGEANPARADDLSTVLALLDERRGNLVAQRTRSVNQLHALLRDLVPGGARTDLTAAAASKVLVGVRPAGPVELARKALARDIVTEVLSESASHQHRPPPGRHPSESRRRSSRSAPVPDLGPGHRDPW